MRLCVFCVCVCARFVCLRVSLLAILFVCLFVYLLATSHGVLVEMFLVFGCLIDSSIVCLFCVFVVVLFGCLCVRVFVGLVVCLFVCLFDCAFPLFRAHVFARCARIRILGVA